MDAALPRLPALTGLRFVAALGVVLWHYRFLIAYPAGVREVVGQGTAGVTLFFVLSGFILTYVYGDWFRTDCRRWPIFARARFARVYPMHLLALLLITPAMLAFGPRYEPVPSGLAWVGQLLLVHAFVPLSVSFWNWNQPSWTLSIELVMYAGFPLFVRHVLAPCRTIRSLVSLALLVFGLEVLAFVLAALAFRLAAPLLPADADLPSLWLMMPPLRVWEFWLGGVVGELWRRLGERSLLRRRVVRDGALAATLLALIALAVWQPGSAPVEARTVAALLAIWPAYLWWPLPFAALILLLASGRTFLSGLLGHPWVVRLGEASYSLYIIHFIPLTVYSGLAGEAGRPPVWLSLLLIGATILAALWCHQAIETPARRWLRGGPAAGRRATDRNRRAAVAGSGE